MMKPLIAGYALRFQPCLPDIEPLTVTVAAGQAVRLVGPSGCGKTTVLRTLARLQLPQAGELALEGHSAHEVPAAYWRRRVAFLPQNSVMLPGSVRENLAAGFATRHRGLAEFDEQRAVSLMEQLGLASAVILERNAQLVSGGEAARIALCRALLLDPRAILADELTAQLDPSYAARVVALLARFLCSGGALIFVTHGLEPWAQLRHLTSEIDLTTHHSPFEKKAPS